MSDSGKGMTTGWAVATLTVFIGVALFCGGVFDHDHKVPNSFAIEDSEGHRAPIATTTPVDLQDASRRGSVSEVREALRSGSMARTEANKALMVIGANYATGSTNPTDYLEIAKLLLDAGADPNFRDSDKATPLHWAASRGLPDVVTFLLSKGAKINARDADGLTPLGDAMHNSGSGDAQDWERHEVRNFTRTIKILKSKGARQ